MTAIAEPPNGKRARYISLARAAWVLLPPTQPCASCVPADPPLLRKRFLDVRWTQTSVACSTLACTWGSTRSRAACATLFVLLIEFFHDVFGHIQGRLVIDHNPDGGFTASVDHGGVALPLRDRLRGLLDLLGVLGHHFALLLLDLPIEFSQTALIRLELRLELVLLLLLGRLAQLRILDRLLQLFKFLIVRVDDLLPRRGIGL